MIQVTLAPEVADKLHNLSEIAELCDTSGRVVGRFVPHVESAVCSEPPMSEEEFQRREQESESLTTEELLANLRKL